MNAFAQHAHEVIENRRDQDADSSPRPPRTHDYTHPSFRWGWRLDIDEVIDEFNQFYRVSGLGPFIRTGDHVLVSMRGGGIPKGRFGIARFVLVDVQYADDPPDLWRSRIELVKWESYDAKKRSVEDLRCVNCRKLISDHPQRVDMKYFCDFNCVSAWEKTDVGRGYFRKRDAEMAEEKLAGPER